MAQGPKGMTSTERCRGRGQGLKVAARRYVRSETLSQLNPSRLKALCLHTREKYWAQLTPRKGRGPQA